MAYPYDEDPVNCIEMGCQWRSTWVDGSRPLYTELRFYRIFFIAAAKWCKDAQLNHLLDRLQTSIRNARSEFHSRVCIQYRTDVEFDELTLLKPEIHKFLHNFISSPFHYSSLKTELVEEHLILLLDTIGDVLAFHKSSQKEQVQLVQEKLHFFKNFLFFISKWNIEQEKLQGVLNHIQVVADIASTYVSFPCLGNIPGDQEMGSDSNISDKEMPHGLFFNLLKTFETCGLSFPCLGNISDEEENISDKYMTSDTLFDLLIQTIKPIKPEVLNAYLHVLKALIPPGSHSYLMYEFIGSFVDFLLQDLNEMLESQENNSLVVPVKDHFEALHKELRFVLTFLISPPEQPAEHGRLDEISAVIEATAVAAGDVVHCLHKREMNAKELDLAVIGLLQQVQHIKPKPGEIYINSRKLPTEPIFPKVDFLGFINSLFENVQHRMSIKSDSIAFVKQQLETVLQDLGSFKSFLKDIADHKHLDDDDEQNVLSTHIVHLAYRIEYAIDSLLVKPSPLWRRLLDDVILEIMFVKGQIMENFVKKTSAWSDHESPRVFTQIPSEADSSLVDEGLVGFDNEAQTIVDEEIVGFEDEAGNIVAKLIKGVQELDIISIVGMPGLGKTTLAKKVFNDKSVSQRFQVRAWCCVSQLYQKKELLLELLCQFVEDTKRIRKMDEQELAHELKRQLQRKRYLIVTDDMWKSEVWDDLRMCFPDDNKGSRIIITTRLNEVALYAKQSTEPHYLRFLNKEESWNLLQKKLFHKDSCPTELVEVGKEISGKCQGLPLFIVLVAGIFGKMEVKPNTRIEDITNSWKRVADDLNWMDKLELSYKHLPNHLRSCFLYFGAFLEDQEIPVSKLIMLWISEGFVQKVESKKQEDVAEEYLMDLIGRSLVMVAKRRSIGGVKSCHVHDLLHKFCLVKAEEESLLQVTSRKLEEQDPVHYSYKYGFDLHEISPPKTPIILEHRRVRIICDRRRFVISRPIGPTVHSLLFHSTRRGFQGAEAFNISFVGHNFKLLRVLDLECMGMGDQFAEEMLLLVHLRFLAVRGGMQSIPSSIVKLWNLTTLLVKGEKGEILLPSTVFQMKSLRHVHINDRTTFELTPSRLDDMVTFSTPSLAFWGNKMRSFPRLRKLRCIFLETWGYCVELRKHCNKFPVLDFLNQLESLKVLYHGKVLSPCKFSFPSNLKKLTLSKFRLPWSEIYAISALENLEVLKLEFRAFEGDQWDVSDVEFKRLKFLKLDFLNIVQWNASDDAFPSLECLVLQKCKRLEEIPSGFGYSSTLKTIQVHWCSSSAEKSAAKIEAIQVQELGNYNFKV